MTAARAYLIFMFEPFYRIFLRDRTRRIADAGDVRSRLRGATLATRDAAANQQIVRS
jgi:hypothetical protein